MTSKPFSGFTAVVASSFLVFSSISFTFFPTSGFSSNVKVSEAPGDDLALTLASIGSARRSVYLNIYDLTSQKVADALLERINAGVKVEILEEGSPVRGLTAVAKEIQSQLTSAMQLQPKFNSHLYEMIHVDGKPQRRFRFDHAKYAVIDGASLLVGSENYSPTGNPEAKKIGNRGWEVLIEDSGLAADFLTLFKEDSDESHGDVIELTSQSPSGRNHGGDGARNSGPGLDAFPTLHASKIETILSPNTSLAGLLTLISHAKTSIDLQQMTFDSTWKGADRSPLVDALEAAAKRGVQIRVLLNDDHTFDRPNKPAKPKNETCASLLNQIGAHRGLHLSARIANVRAMGVDYIHNKGALIDGRLTLVSSINWDYNSVLNNRETAVVLTSPEIFAHYEKLFDSDWNNSALH